MKQDNIIQQKSYAFAVSIVKAYQFLCDEKKEFTLSKQLLRCGTSVGVLATFGLFKTLAINNIKKLTLKMFTEFKKGITFVSTVPLLLPVRSAQGSFFYIGFASKSIHLFCQSLMHTEGVFFLITSRKMAKPSIYVHLAKAL